MADLTLFEFLRESPTPSGAVTGDDLAKDTKALAEALRPAWGRFGLWASVSRDLHEQLVVHSVESGFKHAGISAPERSILRLCAGWFGAY